MKDTQNFTAQRLPNGVTEITDLSGVHCFLVEGRDKALLIDTMTGLRGLPGVCGHPDGFARGGGPDPRPHGPRRGCV